MSQVLKGYALDKQDERTQDQAVLEIAQKAYARAMELIF